MYKVQSGGWHTTGRTSSNIYIASLYAAVPRKITGEGGGIVKGSTEGEVWRGVRMKGSIEGV